MQKEEDNGIIIKGIRHILQCALDIKGGIGFRVLYMKEIGRIRNGIRL